MGRLVEAIRHPAASSSPPGKFSVGIRDPKIGRSVQWHWESFTTREEAFHVLHDKFEEIDAGAVLEGAITYKSEGGEYLEVIQITRWPKLETRSWKEWWDSVWNG